MKMVYNKIKDSLKQSMKDKEKEKTLVFKWIISEIDKYVKDNKIAEINEDIVYKCLEKEIKSNNEVIEDYRKQNKDDLVATSELTISICKSFLPEKISEEETIATIKELFTKHDDKANINKTKGLVMKELSPNKTNYDWGLVVLLVNDIARTLSFRNI